MSAKSIITLVGKSGNKYPFEVYSCETTFNPVGAVYAVTRADDKSVHTILYIGQTETLCDRHDDHHKQECFDRNNANCICVHVDSSEDSRRAKETDLCRKYNCICNG
jgi:hypothetical protein